MQHLCFTTITILVAGKLFLCRTPLLPPSRCGNASCPFKGFPNKAFQRLSTSSQLWKFLHSDPPSGMFVCYMAFSIKITCVLRRRESMAFLTILQTLKSAPCSLYSYSHLHRAPCTLICPRLLAGLPRLDRKH